MINGEDQPGGFTFEGSALIFDGAEIRTVSGGRITARCFVSDFLRRPNAVFRQIMRSVRETGPKEKTG